MSLSVVPFLGVLCFSCSPFLPWESFAPWNVVCYILSFTCVVVVFFFLCRPLISGPYYSFCNLSLIGFGVTFCLMLSSINFCSFDVVCLSVSFHHLMSFYPFVSTFLVVFFYSRCFLFLDISCSSFSSLRFQYCRFHFKFADFSSNTETNSKRQQRKTHSLVGAGYK